VAQVIEYRCKCPFKFTGKIDKLTLDLDPAQDTEGAGSRGYAGPGTPGAGRPAVLRDPH